MLFNANKIDKTTSKIENAVNVIELNFIANEVIASKKLTSDIIRKIGRRLLEIEFDLIIIE